MIFSSHGSSSPFLFFLQEIDHLLELEEVTLSSDLSQGYALKMLTGNGRKHVPEDFLKHHT